MKSFTGMLSGVVFTIVGIPILSSAAAPFSQDISAMLINTATIAYDKSQYGHGSFDVIDYNPLLLVAYKSSMFMEAAVDLALDDQGNTNTNLNNLNINLMLFDDVILGAGKFDSALGKFVANLSPPWINRLPTAPVGFNSEEAAPQSEIGLELRGGIAVFENQKANYNFFLTNGPRAILDPTNTVVDHISTDGFGDSEGNYAFGTRLGYLPIPAFEIGISAALGKVAVLDTTGSTVLDEDRQYNVYGADASYKCHAISLRAEIIQQQIGSDSNEVSPQSGKWQAWYLQGAYLFPSYSLEPVLRYGQYNPADPTQYQKQLAVGLNYWLTPSMVAQAAYHFNNGQAGSDADADLTTVQLVINF